MCGFAGELARGRPADLGAVERMAATLAPRGPDGSGAWAAGPVALVHRRLEVIDWSERRGHQALVDPHTVLA